MKKTELPRWATGFVLPILNLLSALIVAGVVIHLLGESPLDSLRILIDSAILDPEGLGYTLFYASTFIFAGLAVSIAMQAGLFNIGAEGQMYVGGLGLTLAVLAFDASLPGWLLIPMAMVGAARATPIQRRVSAGPARTACQAATTMGTNTQGSSSAICPARACSADRAQSRR